MTDTRAILAWFRRDLRLHDNPMLAAAAATGRPVVPVFLDDEVVGAMGAAPAWRLGLGLERLAGALRAAGSPLVLRRGTAVEALPALARETGGEVWWTRLHDPDAVRRDEAALAALARAGVPTRVFDGHLLHPPEAVATGGGGHYKVFTPFWRAIEARPVPEPQPAPAHLRPLSGGPSSDDLGSWALGREMRRGAAVVARHVAPGEAAGLNRLARFLADDVGGYETRRDLPGVRGSSRLSDYLTLGEVSVRTAWHGARRATEEGKAGAGTFLKELGWRDFAHHLLHHAPHMTNAHWRAEWDGFPWRGDNPEAEAWRRGRTGVRLVDAAMRELYATGRVHNRARMVAASFLTKHLLTDWRVGCAWFADCLVDWDPANNALGWQWIAGSGPDAAPFFRIFNPDGQAEKFDADGTYSGHWIAEGATHPSADALSFFDALPRAWGMAPGDRYPEPIIGLKEGRDRALAAYERARG